MNRNKVVFDSYPFFFEKYVKIGENFKLGGNNAPPHDSPITFDNRKPLDDQGTKSSLNWV